MIAELEKMASHMEEQRPSGGAHVEE